MKNEMRWYLILFYLFGLNEVYPKEEVNSRTRPQLETRETSLDALILDPNQQLYPKTDFSLDSKWWTSLPSQLQNKDIQALTFQRLQSTFTLPMNPPPIDFHPYDFSIESSTSMDWKTVISRFVLRREENAAEISIDTDSKRVSSEGCVSYTTKNDKGSSCTFSVGGTVKIDRDGKSKGGVTAKGAINW